MFPYTERPTLMIDELRRRMEGLLSELNSTGGRAPTDFPTVNIAETEDAYTLTAVVPGVEASDLNLRSQSNVLTLSGERAVSAPEGYSLHRRERVARRFARSFAFPVRVDFDQAQAQLKEGILTLRLPKHADALPRRITVAG